MGVREKPLVWMRGEVKTPPMSSKARVEAGYLLRQLQDGVSMGLPHARPMPILGPRCLELRVGDEQAEWRILLRMDADAIVIVDVFRKTTRATPRHILEAGRRRLAAYDLAVKGRKR